MPFDPSVKTTFRLVEHLKHGCVLEVLYSFPFDYPKRSIFRETYETKTYSVQMWFNLLDGAVRIPDAQSRWHTYWAFNLSLFEAVPDDHTAGSPPYHLEDGKGKVREYQRPTHRLITADVNSGKTIFCGNTSAHPDDVRFLIHRLNTMLTIAKDILAPMQDQAKQRYIDDHNDILTMPKHVYDQIKPIVTEVREQWAFARKEAGL